MSDKAKTINVDTSKFVEIKFPDIVRAVPAFTIDVPSKWVVSEYPGSLFAMGTANDTPGPWSNVIVKHDRVLPNTAMEQIAILSWQDLLVECPKAKAKNEQMILFEQYHYAREAEVTVKGVKGKVTRFDSFVFGPDLDNATVDLFHFIWTHPVDAGDERTALYLNILATLHFEKARRKS